MPFPTKNDFIQAIQESKKIPKNGLEYIEILSSELHIEN